MGSEFKESYAVGRKMENYICERFKRKYSKSYVRETDNGPFSKYDVVIPEINQTVEVKQDFKSKHTGNIVAEIVFNDRPSALSLTKADLWAIVTGYRILYIKPVNIWKCVYEKDYTPRYFKGDGDTKYKWAFLISESDLLEYCEKIITLTDKDNEYRDNFVKETKHLHDYN